MISTSACFLRKLTCKTIELFHSSSEEKLVYPLGKSSPSLDFKSPIFQKSGVVGMERKHLLVDHFFCECL
jgi:hypothetical protein